MKLDLEREEIIALLIMILILLLAFGEIIYYAYSIRKLENPKKNEVIENKIEITTFMSWCQDKL